MGTTGVMGMAEAVSDGAVSLQNAMYWHLQHNHYPPVPESMIPVCLVAVDMADEGEWDAEIALPEGASYQGRPYAPVWAIVQQHHLEAFLSD